MTTTPVQRREPVQERSRQTVTRILDAAAAIIDESGAEAVTTRSVADRAGVSYPSLYRFFGDREEILDRLLERHLAEVDALAVEAERSWDIRSAADLIDAELDLHITYYRQHPSAARLWMGGRTSPVVARKARARMKTLASRMHQALAAAGLVPAGTDPLALLVAVELADRVLDLAYRDGTDLDDAIIGHGRMALRAYAEHLASQQPR